MVAELPVPDWWAFSIRGVTLRGTVQGGDGRQAGPSVVAVHGGPGIDGAGLRLVLAPLADQAELVVPDLRGHGRSDLATSETWTLDDWADDLAAVIEALRLCRPVIVGVSFGGWVALRCAASYPELVGGLVIAATTARLPSVPEGGARLAQLGGPASAAAWTAAHTDYGFELSADFERHVLSLMAMRQPSAALLEVRRTQTKTPQVNEHFTPQFSRLDLTADAASTRCPVALLVGERDPLTTPELAKATAEACAGLVQFQLIANAGHDLLVDAPDALLDAIRGVLTIRQLSNP